MSEGTSSNISNQISDNKKKCNYCNVHKEKQNFCCPYSNNPLYEYATCNDCSERPALNIGISSSQITNISNILQVDNSIDDDDLELTSEANLFFNNELVNTTQIEEYTTDIQINKYDNNADTLLYSINEVESFINTQFQDAELSEEPTKFEFDIELDSELLDAVMLAVDEYKEALQAHNQQGTQRSSNKKLAYWLH
ncbi:1090_t:CDS:2 [Dentiscutata erythropus]|uniref:1090_t:CDS:1 n=1 Tax=Dentiscutata erythropus TaxID=1348616 RepID=A0A9N9HU00_9GLOM|nr:1090_t:CDS:2 [Dentiscutata erythropus]